MGHLKSKSEINFSAAELLHKQSHYPAVIHCAYYSCVQLMRHIWIHKMGKSLEDLGLLTKNTKEGSHEVLINQLRHFLKGKALDERTFNNDIVQLKKLRTKADYANVQIDHSISNLSISLSKSTQAILKKTL